MSVELNENSMENLLKDFDVKKINSGDILKLILIMLLMV